MWMGGGPCLLRPRGLSSVVLNCHERNGGGSREIDPDESQLKPVKRVTFWMSPHFYTARKNQACKARWPMMAYLVEPDQESISTTRFLCPPSRSRVLFELHEKKRSPDFAPPILGPGNATSTPKHRTSSLGGRGHSPRTPPLSPSRTRATR